MDALNALIAFLNFVFIPGLAYGAQLALGALGVTLIYGILRFSNFAHGDTMAFGTMVTILMTWWFQSLGVSLGPLPTALLALPFGIAATAAFVLGTDRVVYRFYRRAKATPTLVVIVSLGVMFVMNGIVRLIIGVDDQNFADGARFVINPQDFRAATGMAEPLALRTSQVVTVVTAVVVVAFLFWFLQKTRTGKRACFTVWTKASSPSPTSSCFCRSLPRPSSAVLAARLAPSRAGSSWPSPSFC